MNIGNEILKLFQKIDTTPNGLLVAREIEDVRSQNSIFASRLSVGMNIDEFSIVYNEFYAQNSPSDDVYIYAQTRVLDRVWTQDKVNEHRFTVATKEGIPIPSHLNFNTEDGEYMLRFLSFDSETFVNTSVENLPEGWNPELIIEQGKNPGCHVREMHKLGYTGSGINVAIIDSPILTEHSEIKSSLVSYYQDYSEFNEYAFFHGQAVSGILVGDETGIAKDADLYYFAVNTQTTDKRLSALRKILEHNATCNPDEKIQVVSLSWGINKGGDGYEEYRDLLKELYNSGVFVATADFNMLDETLFGTKMNYGALVKKDQTVDSDDFSNYTAMYNFHGAPQEILLVPCGDRTVASCLGNEKYRHDSAASTSWSTPALAGIYASVLQCAVKNNVELSPAIFWQYALETGVEIKDDSGRLMGKAINAEALCLYIENLGKIKAKL